METRLIAASDAPALAALHGESFAAAAWNLAQIGQSFALPTTRGWLASESGQPIGFLLCQISGGESEILTFCVASSARRKGAGRALLAAAMEEARAKGACRMFLEVASDNLAAASLYEKAGFRVTGRRAAYYRSGADAVMYALDL
ncbi:MAG: ribosomal protein S18-alanine N-acetyltransferase [Alphaproteobacteria bacterium]|nr:ribosomal protein S18-alanine N-acetyltransferase [Alphaproteobacteria bacterium]